MGQRSVLQLMGSLLGAARGKSGSQATAADLVGAWHLQSQGAPILHHVLCFHADGIVTSFQADGGFPTDSESNGAGSWQWVGENQVQGMFLEFCHDRTTHEYVGSVEVHFCLTLKTNTLRGQATTHLYDVQGTRLAVVTPTWVATRMLFSGENR